MEKRWQADALSWEDVLGQGQSAGKGAQGNNRDAALRALWQWAEASASRGNETTAGRLSADPALVPELLSKTV
ncbi:hypothetical protein A4R35_05915 [Thermogemmatispora tikiterensis]|uniref:Uncharacterized protein n=1 Tax=Thermogemmatispora tikiterensis TaxID=1825093 RepID=A0A328VIZ9_9CHLR|nr:hypothetical protein A4R35_05915 [Thermogemmatispora tikiterensis]